MTLSVLLPWSTLHQEAKRKPQYLDWSQLQQPSPSPHLGLAKHEDLSLVLTEHQDPHLVLAKQQNLHLGLAKHEDPQLGLAKHQDPHLGLAKHEGLQLGFTKHQNQTNPWRRWTVRMDSSNGSSEKERSFAQKKPNTLQRSSSVSQQNIASFATWSRAAQAADNARLKTGMVSLAPVNLLHRFGMFRGQKLQESAPFITSLRK